MFDFVSGCFFFVVRCGSCVGCFECCVIDYYIVCCSGIGVWELCVF